MTELLGAGESTVEEQVATLIGAPALGHDIEDIWLRHFEAEHYLHWVLPSAVEPERDRRPQPYFGARRSGHMSHALDGTEFDTRRWL